MRLYTSFCRSVRPSVRPSVRHTLLFWGFCGLWPHCSCPNDLVTSNTAPAHPHATGVAVYLALLTLLVRFFLSGSTWNISILLGMMQEFNHNMHDHVRARRQMTASATRPQLNNKDDDHTVVSITSIKDTIQYVFLKWHERNGSNGTRFTKSEKCGK